MKTYVTLAKWTKQGVENIKESPARLDAFKKLVQSAGGTVKAFYMVAGRYDLVLILEVPDDQSMAKVALATASKGGVSTETLLAFPEEEYRKIIGSLP